MVQGNHSQKFSFLKQVETIAISPFNRTKVCACRLENSDILFVQLSSPDVKLKDLVSYTVSRM